MRKEEYKTITLMAARLLGLQAEVYYLQMFDPQNEKPKILDAFLDKVASLPKTNIGAKVATQLKKRGFALSAKQAYHIAKTAIRHKIELHE